MSAAIAILFALGSAACFGCGDFLAQGLTRRHGSLAAMLAVQIASALLLGVAALLWHGPPTIAGAELPLLLLLGLGNTVGIVGLYRAFEVGELSLVSPIAGSMGAFTVLFAWLGGEPPVAGMLPALIMVIVGIVVASIIQAPPEQADHKPRKLGRALGVGWALLSAVTLGWVFFALAPSGARLGPVWVVWTLRLVALAILWPLFRRLRRRDAPAPAMAAGAEPPGVVAARATPKATSFRLRSRGQGPSPRRHEEAQRRLLTPAVLVVAGLDSLGMVLYAFASSHSLGTGQVATVAVLASSFPLVTIALAHLRLRESLRWWQWMGVVAVLAGVAWLSASSAG